MLGSASKHREKLQMALISIRSARSPATWPSEGEFSAVSWLRWRCNGQLWSEGITSTSSRSTTDSRSVTAICQFICRRASGTSTSSMSCSHCFHSSLMINTTVYWIMLMRNVFIWIGTSFLLPIVLIILILLMAFSVSITRDVAPGDWVTVGECRPLSKTVRFNVLKVTKSAGAKKSFQKF